MRIKTRTVAVIVAHPDDETLWAGGTMLSAPQKEYFILSLCRKSDADRAPKFEKALQAYGATGAMADMDDGPEQTPLQRGEVERAILNLLPLRHYDRILTHSPFGEYTRHRRHEETGRAVLGLWKQGKLKTSQLWLFAYEDGGRVYLPVADDDATLTYTLPHDLWERKHDIITHIYGFNKTSWEAQTTPKREAFRQFSAADQAYAWIKACSEITT